MHTKAAQAPDSPTGYPNIWLRITVPRVNSLRMYTGTALLTSFRHNAPHDEVASWILKSNSFTYTIETGTVDAGAGA